MTRARTLAFFCLAVSALAQSAAETPRPARLEGVVVNLAGEPVARAQVRLQGQTRVERGQAMAGAAYTANTGDDGKFVMENIDPARNLNLTAQRTGFVTARYGMRSVNSPAVLLDLAPGESLTGLTITMTPQAVISGRVLDPAGDPVQGIQLMLQRWGYQRGVRQLVTQTNASSNDQGGFRFANLMPGRYYLLTRDSRGVEYGNGVIALPTYYPSGADARSAGPIDLAAGQELRGVDIRLRQGRTFLVSGKVLEASGAPAANIYLLPRRADDPNGNYNVQTQSRPDGAFELRGLLPGPYNVEAVSTQSGTRTVGRFNLNVAGANISDLVFTIGPITGSAALSGTMRLEEGDLEELLPKPDANTQNSAQLAIAATNAGVPVSGFRPVIGLSSVATTVGGTPPAQLKPDGTFTIENVAPGKYTVSIAALPTGVYVKSVRFGSTDALRAGIDFASSGKLDIVLAKNPASVTGTVQNEQGEPQPGVLLTLWTKDPETGSSNNGVRTANTDRKGQFEFPDLRPGAYSLAAWEDIDSGLAQVREFLELVKADAATAELTPGERRTLQMRLIPVAKIQAAEEKLQ